LAVKFPAGAVSFSIPKKKLSCRVWTASDCLVTRRAWDPAIEHSAINPLFLSATRVTRRRPSAAPRSTQLAQAGGRALLRSTVGTVWLVEEKFGPGLYSCFPCLQKARLPPTALARRHDLFSCEMDNWLEVLPFTYNVFEIALYMYVMVCCE